MIDSHLFGAWVRAPKVSFSAGPDYCGLLRLTAAEAARTLASVEPVDAHGLGDRDAARARFGKAALHGLFGLVSTCGANRAARRARRATGSPAGHHEVMAPGD